MSFQLSFEKMEKLLNAENDRMKFHRRVNSASPTPRRRCKKEEGSLTSTGTSRETAIASTGYRRKGRQRSNHGLNRLRWIWSSCV